MEVLEQGWCVCVLCSDWRWWFSSTGCWSQAVVINCCQDQRRRSVVKPLHAVLHHNHHRRRHAVYCLS